MLLDRFRQGLPSERVEFERALATVIMARLGVPVLLFGEYRNPFDFIDETGQWIEFETRRYWLEQSTNEIIQDMLSHDLSRAANSFDSDYTLLRITCKHDLGRYSPVSSSVVTRGSF
jgi:hypothetical protein